MTGKLTHARICLFTVISRYTFRLYINSLDFNVFSFPLSIHVEMILQDCAKVSYDLWIQFVQMYFCIRKSGKLMVDVIESIFKGNVDVRP